MCSNGSIISNRLSYRHSVWNETGLNFSFTGVYVFTRTNVNFTYHTNAVSQLNILEIKIKLCVKMAIRNRYIKYFSAKKLFYVLQKPMCCCICGHVYAVVYFHYEIQTVVHALSEPQNNTVLLVVFLSLRLSLHFHIYKWMYERKDMESFTKFVVLDSSGKSFRNRKHMN